MNLEAQWYKMYVLAIWARRIHNRSLCHKQSDLLQLGKVIDLASIS